MSALLTDMSVYVAVADGLTLSDPEQLEASQEYVGRCVLMKTLCRSAVVVVNDNTLAWPAWIVAGLAVNDQSGGVGGLTGGGVTGGSVTGGSSTGGGSVTGGSSTGGGSVIGGPATVTVTPSAGYAAPALLTDVSV
jgi:hypothetical protein